MDIKNWKAGATLALMVGLAATVAACSSDTVGPSTDAGSDATGDDAADAASDAAETSTDSGAATDSGTSADSDAATDSATTADAADGADATDSATADAGSVADCLSSTSDFDAIFTLQDSSKCLVGQYSVAATGLAGLTWGRHGGPLGLDSSTATSPTIVRYQVPAAATGAITTTKQALTPPSLPSTVYWGSQAVDLPFFGWTAIAYTGSGTAFPGELLLTDASSNLTRYDVNGLFDMNAVGLSGGRLLYTGLSPIGTTTSATNTGALYAADACGSASSSPRLVPNGDATCKAPAAISSWQSGSSGPVTKDVAENVFAILMTYGASQELRGFEASTIAHDAAPTAGDTLATLTGGGSELAADGKSLYFQPDDASTYAALDVVAIDYTVNAATKKLTAATPRGFLKLVKAGTAASLVTDTSGRLWVVVAKPGSTTESWMFVVRSKNP